LKVPGELLGTTMLATPSTNMLVQVHPASDSQTSSNAVSRDLRLMVGNYFADDAGFTSFRWELPNESVRRVQDLPGLRCEASETSQ